MRFHGQLPPLLFLILLPLLFPVDTYSQDQPADDYTFLKSISAADKTGNFKTANAIRRKRIAANADRPDRLSYFKRQLSFFETLEQLSLDDQQRLGEVVTTLERFRANDMAVAEEDFQQIDVMISIANKLIGDPQHPIRTQAATLHAAKLLQMGEFQAAVDKLRQSIAQCNQAFGGGPSVEQTIPGIVLALINPDKDLIIARNRFLKHAEIIQSLVGDRCLWYAKAIGKHTAYANRKLLPGLIVQIDTLRSYWSTTGQKNTPEYIELTKALILAAAESNPERCIELGDDLKSILADQNQQSSEVYAATLANQSAAFIIQKSYVVAKENLRRSIAYYQTSSEMHRGTWSLALRLRGRLELAGGNDELAFATFQESYEVFMKNADEFSTRLAKYTVPIADEFIEFGFVDQAIRIYQRALHFEILNGTDDKLISVIMDRLAIAYSSMYQPVVAREAWQRSLNSGIATLNIAIAKGDFDGVAQKWNRLKYILRDFVSLTDAEDPSQCMLAFEYACRVKGMFGRMLAAENDISIFAVDETQLEMQAEFSEALEKVAETAFQTKSNMVRENEIEILEAKQRKLLEDITSMYSKRTQRIIGKEAITDGIIKHISEDTAVVEIVRAVNISDSDKDDYVVFVLTKVEEGKKFAVNMIRLDETEVIDKIAREWRTLVQSRQTVDRDIIEPLGLDVREAIWKPIAKHFEGKTNIVISGDGELARFPWAAIPRIKSRFAANRLPVWLLASLLVIALVMLTMIRIRQTSSWKTVVAGVCIMAVLWVGWKAWNAPQEIDKYLIADFDITVCSDSFLLVNASSQDKKTGDFNLLGIDLPEEKFNGEIKMVESTVPRPNKLDTKKPRRSLLNYLNNSPKGFLHLASLNGCETPPMETEPNTSSTKWKSQFHPLLHSYITTTENTRIAGKQILQLKLNTLDTIVLSTRCGSEESQDAVLRGNFDLQQAFLLAEAPTVVGTLWDTTPDAARVFAKQYYTALNDQTLSRSAAFREAQIKMIKAGQPPSCWAAWSMAGARD